MRNNLLSETDVRFRKPREERMEAGQRVLFTIIFVLFVLYAITLLYPVIWMFMSSLKGSLEYSGGDPFALPQKWLFSNYLEAVRTLKLKNTTYFGMIWNSLWTAGGSVIVGLFASAIVCYVMAKLEFPGRKIIYTINILIMMIPIYGALAADFKLKGDLGLYDNPLNIIISSLGPITGLRFLVLYAFFKGISWEYAEAGLVDGASQARIFFSIMLPQAIPPLVTFAMTDFIGAWNDYMTPLIYLPSYPTLASGLYEYEANMTRAVKYPVYYAGVIISTIPILALFVAFRDMFMSSLSVGGLKG